MLILHCRYILSGLQVNEKYYNLYSLTRNLLAPGQFPVTGSSTAGVVNPPPDPDKVAHWGHPLPGTQFPNQAKPGMIEAANRHDFAPFVKWPGKTHFAGQILPIRSSFVKVMRR